MLSGSLQVLRLVLRVLFKTLKWAVILFLCLTALFVVLFFWSPSGKKGTPQAPDKEA